MAKSIGQEWLAKHDPKYTPPQAKSAATRRIPWDSAAIEATLGSGCYRVSKGRRLALNSPVAIGGDEDSGFTFEPRVEADQEQVIDLARQPKRQRGKRGGRRHRR